MTNPRLTKLGWLAVSVGGLGALRPAPGTWGSLPPVAIALVTFATTLRSSLSKHSVQPCCKLP